MGNLFGEIGKRATDLVSYPISAAKDLVTDPKKGIDKFKNLYTHNTHKDQDLFQKGFGIKGWVGDHPQESAAAVVGTIFGGWMAAPAAGGTAAGAGGTAAAGTAGTAAGTGAGTLGGVGASAYMAPAAAGGVGTSSGAMATGLGATGGSTFTPAMLTTQGAAAASGTGSAAGAGGSLANTSALMQMGHLGAAGQGMGSGVGAAGTGFSTSSLSASGAQSAMAAGGDYGVSSPLLSTSQAPSGGAASTGGNSVQWDRLSKTLNSVKQNNEQNQQRAPASFAPAYRAQFTPSKGNQNELLTKTMQDIYSQPTYAPLSISR